MKTIAVCIVAIVLALAPGTVLAAPEDVANEVDREIMSPYCPGVTLHDCPSEPALEMRERIAGWAADGWSKEKILTHLESEWGSVIRATPPTEGAGLLAWVLPGLAVLCGAVAVFFVSRRWSRRRAASPAPPEVSSSDRARLEKELAEIRSEA